MEGAPDPRRTYRVNLSELPAAKKKILATSALLGSEDCTPDRMLICDLGSAALMLKNTLGRSPPTYEDADRQRRFACE